MNMKNILSASLMGLALFNTAFAQSDEKAFLNVSYDVMRDFYKQYNPLYMKHYAQANDGKTFVVQQSHGGSSKQALSVANGLQADVVTMNQKSDIDLLEKKGLIRKDWEQAFANHSVPFTSTTVILVRKGNPKKINDFKDLSQEGVKVVMANPKTTGNGRYTFLALYGSALKHYQGDQEQAKQMVKSILKNVPILDNGGRAATATFVQRGIGDALMTFENEANMAAKEFGKDQFEVIYPKYSILAENPVAIVDTVVQKKNSLKRAQDYLNYLWSEPAQELAASLYLRPSDAKVLSKYRQRFPVVNTFRASDLFGSWDTVMKQFFADGALFDQLNKR